MMINCLQDFMVEYQPNQIVFVIEPDIPLSAKVHYSDVDVSSLRWEDMQQGDSVFIDEHITMVKNHLNRYQNETGAKFTIRSVPGGIRIWRGSSTELLGLF